MELALEEAALTRFDGKEDGNFMLLPRDVAAQASRWWTDLEEETGGSVPHVCRREWIPFLRTSATCDEQAA